MEAFDRLIDVVRSLRGPRGCDWDRAQTPATLRPYLLEEAYEVLEAIDRGDAQATAKELGDLLFLITSIGLAHEERGAFDLSDIPKAAADKMIRRHPHVFADAAERPLWEEQKQVERAAEGRDRSVLEGLPRALPALLRAARVSARAASVGFDWPDRDGVRAKVDEELGELDEALRLGAPDAIAEEFGDLLFSLVNLGRFLPVGAEDALRMGTDKFERRFRAMERALLEAGGSVSTTDPTALEAAWEKAKEAVG